MTKHYCCYGAYADVGHSDDCRSLIGRRNPAPHASPTVVPQGLEGLLSGSNFQSEVADLVRRFGAAKIIGECIRLTELAERRAADEHAKRRQEWEEARNAASAKS